MSMLKGLVPPKIANPKSIGVAADAARMTRVVSFYKALPRGPAPKPAGGYKAKYIDGKDVSGLPLVHLIGGLFVIGYSLDYAFHLSHHKSHEHH